MKRRQFLWGSLAAVTYIACGSDDAGDTPETRPNPTAPDGGASGDGAGPILPTSPPATSDRLFPQGVASGDPRPDRVLLWTRAEPDAIGKAGQAFDLTFLIAEDEALTKVVGTGTVKAAPDVDHTVRVVATGLKPATVYYYRFDTGGTTTQVGRTKTAPDESADVPVKFAFAACQDFIGRYYHAWQALLDEKADLDFVMWLGDYIYETVNDPRFQSTTPERSVTLPDGMDTSAAQDGTRTAAKTLADYRTLYKTYRSDPVLREVHRLYPFIVTWDDHEFADDCWQDHSTSFNELDPVTKGFTSEQNTPRRLGANRAFSEFQPIDVAYDAAAPFPTDITIYRKLRYGKHVELFMTDQRMYRADHLIPEGPSDIAVGKLQQNTSIGSRYFVRKSVFDTREVAAKPTMLGATQKAWFLDAVKASTATWKLWGNEVQMYQMALKLGDVPGIPAFVTYTAYVSCDQWDGYRSERAEILGALQAAGVDNLVVCTGDIHSFFAAELHVDFDNPQVKPVAVEFVTAGISSANLGALIGNLLGGSSLGAVGDFFIGGADAGLKATNSHLRYSDTKSNGVAVMDVGASRVDVTFLAIGDPRDKTSAGVVKRTKLVTQTGTNKVTVT